MDAKEEKPVWQAILKRRKTMFALGAIATIGLGALGSGAWEYIVEPALIGARNITLNIASLGVESFKGQLYRDVGRLELNAAGLATLHRVTILYAAGLVGLALWAFSMRSKIRAGLAANLGRIDKNLEQLKNITEGSGREETPSPERLKRELLAIREEAVNIPIKRFSGLVYSMAFLVLVALTMAVMDWVRVEYTHRAHAYVRQMIAVVAPYIDDQREEIFLARLAGVDGREEYTALVTSLQSVANENGVSPPQFSIW